VPIVGDVTHDPRGGGTTTAQPSTRTAAYVERLGGADEIVVGPLPVPPLGPTEVLVAVEATAVNHVDTFVRSGRWRTTTPFPFVIGRDLVGRVVDVGPAVTGFRPGDRVWSNSMGHGGRQGVAASLVAVDQERLYPVPDGVDPVDLVAAVHPAATAWLALHVHARAQAGEVLLVIGAAGNVGAALVALGDDAGVRVIASCGPEHHEDVRALGADGVIGRVTAEDVAASVRGVLGDLAPDGVDVVIDTSGSLDPGALLPLLRPRGRVVVLAGGATSASFQQGDLYQRDLSVVGFVISRAKVSELADVAAGIGPLLAEGRLRPARIEELPLSDAAAAHRRLEQGTLRGTRIVLRPPAPSLVE